MSSELCRECRAPLRWARGSARLAARRSERLTRKRTPTPHPALLRCRGVDCAFWRLDPEYPRSSDQLSTGLPGRDSPVPGPRLSVPGRRGDVLLRIPGRPRRRRRSGDPRGAADLEDIKVVNQGIGKRLHAEIHVRLGLHSGVAVVGEVGHGGRDRLAVGETVNLAARIQLFAQVDTVLVSASTARLIDGYFELESLRGTHPQGFARPVELFRVVRSTGARTKFEATARGS